MFYVTFPDTEGPSVTFSDSVGPARHIKQRRMFKSGQN